MKPMIVVLACSFLSTVSADRGSCVGRCDQSFTPLVKCQCDNLCKFYRSCCEDYDTVCKRVRGDVFHMAEDEYADALDSPTVDYWTAGPDYMEATVEPEPSLGPELGPSLEPDPEPSLEPDPEQDPSLEPDPKPSLEPDPEPSLEPDPEPSLDPEPQRDPSLDPEPQQDPSVDPEPQQDPSVDPEPQPEPCLDPEPEPEPEPVDLCTSKQPIDAFTDLKNGSIYAFQGEYFYELDKCSVISDYPRLIREVWGMHGPIDAAFTRINCEGKTYIFKGDSYWRFSDGILERDFPRLIKHGFPGIPNNVDATLAVPANNIDGKERVYFFKGNVYWEYIFQTQPSQMDCASSSISDVFLRYTDIDNSWEDFFTSLFQVTSNVGANGPKSIRKNWRGIPGHVDSAMIGKLFFIRQFPRSGRRKPKKPKKPKKPLRWNQRRGQWRKHSSSMEMDLFSSFIPSQSVYFFVKDQYYRVDLETKQVADARPSYPRSIATYWFKCMDVHLSHE
ncbi:vitronectin-like [Stegostoma tigrinum]|uniref:vitronectin-like n=1 Tax=Stegostoma tigrinum TaxID=3053191 RepID=UPI0028701AE8|nr:vitronectin-like [Stegostoma tigrinum]